MTAKELFRELSRLEAFVSVKELRAEALKSLASSPTTTHITGLPGNPSKSKSPMADAICKAVDLENEIIADRRLIQEKRLFLLEAISRLECSDYQTILIKRYFEHMSWVEIAKSMCYTKRWLYKLHGLALLEMDKMVKNADDRQNCSP